MSSFLGRKTRALFFEDGDDEPGERELCIASYEMVAVYLEGFTADWGLSSGNAR